MGDKLNAMKQAAGKPKPKAAQKKGKAPVRGCCATERGQNVPHAEDCISRQPKKPKRPKMKNLKSRLPDQSRFELVYTAKDAESGTWSGVLAVPGMEPIRGEWGGVFKLLSVLDETYRKAVSRG